MPICGVFPHRSANLLKVGQSRQQRWIVGFSFKQGKTVTTKEVLQKNDDINPLNFSLNELVSLVSHTNTHNSKTQKKQ